MTTPYICLMPGTGVDHIKGLTIYWPLMAECGIKTLLELEDSGRGPIPETHIKISERLDKKFPDHDRQLILVGHSQGAIQALRYVMNHPDRDIRVASVCGPLLGGKCTFMVRSILRVLLIRDRVMQESLWQMKAGSPFMLEFVRELTEWADGLGPELAYRLFCGYSRKDELIQAENAYLAGATLFASNLCDHFSIVYSLPLCRALRQFCLMERPGSINLPSIETVPHQRRLPLVA